MKLNAAAIDRKRDSLCMKKFIFKRKAFISLLIGTFLLSGCGQSDNFLIEVTDNDVNEEIDTNVTEPEDKPETDENTGLSENLRKPLEVPVNSRAEDIHYHGEDGIDLFRAVHCCKSDGEKIYLAYNEPDLYVMSIGADEHSPANIDNPEGMNVCNVAVDTYGRIHLLMVGQNYDKCYIWRLDEDYRIDKVIDISAYFETKRTPLWFLIDKDGTYYFQWPIDRNGIIVDSEGVLKHKFTRESLGIREIYEAAVGKDGQIYLVYGTYEDVKREIGELDVENCSIKEEDSPLSFSGNEVFAAMSGGTDTNLLLFSPFSGVWAYDNEQGIMENRVPLSDLDPNINTEIQPLTFLPDGRLLLLVKTVNSNNSNNSDDKELVVKYIPAGKR